MAAILRLGSPLNECVSERFFKLTHYHILEWLDVVPFEEVYDNLGMFGTPDAVAEKVRWMRDEGGVGQLMNFMGFGGLPQEKVLRNMRLFAEEVMPRFKESDRPAKAEGARG